MSLEVPNKRSLEVPLEVPNINILEMLKYLGLLHYEWFPSRVPNGLLWFEQLVPIYVECVLMLSVDCCTFLQVMILFYFLVVLMDTFYMIFVIPDLDLDFGLVRVLC